MRPRHPTAIALAASLACHATLMWSALRFGQYDRVAAEPRAPSALVKPAALPPEHLFGEDNGLGEALSTLDAPQELRSTHEAQDQPWLGLLPHGPLRPEAPTPSQMLALSESAPALPAPADWREMAEALRPTGDSGEPAPPQQSTVAITPAPRSPIEPQQPARQHADSAADATAATDPGAAADREVDLFTKEAFAEYRAGRATARQGREFKIRGLRRGLAAFVEQAFLPRPIVVSFELLVDKDGTPIDIRVEKSSGSDVLDQQIRKDLFNSWFDPDPSGTGRDLGKRFRFTIRIV